MKEKDQDQCKECGSIKGHYFDCPLRYIKEQKNNISHVMNHKLS